MKTRWCVIVLLAAVVGLASCGGSDKPKSNECQITDFSVSGVKYTVTQLSITHTYSKVAENTWENLPTAPVAPDIKFSDKASIDPLPSIPQPFGQEGGFSRTYTVTAEDGTKATYTVTVTRPATLN